MDLLFGSTQGVGKLQALMLAFFVRCLVVGFYIEVVLNKGFWGVFIAVQCTDR